jgi:hypothetical protein
MLRRAGAGAPDQLHPIHYGSRMYVAALVLCFAVAL